MISLPQLHDPPPGEGCGTCTACCDITGVVELGKPYYARCPHLGAGCCTIYDHRPETCRVYRCAWHLGMIGTHIDRRPDKCGVMFQFDQHNGRWMLGMFELTPGAAKTEKARYLRDNLLKSKKIKHLPLASPAVHVYPFGADVPPPYPVSGIYDYVAPADPKVPTRQIGGEMVFSGRVREMLMPRK